ncbi:hypothetical protein AZE42_12236 [Rhizopogon vesiculosus]|uniref:Uncharacterized protein n=1 Tax=Rhizopogon vesiculosus TaxID=180088 RepID=A0A1J8QZ04_9AGAM|nr:hypothetical protein AZE42_12236 [Rhizopogon vesiculosus]
MRMNYYRSKGDWLIGLIHHAMPFSSIVYAKVILCNGTEVELQTLTWLSAANVKNSDLIHLPSCDESQL